MEAARGEAVLQALAQDDADVVGALDEDDVGEADRERGEHQQAGEEDEFGDVVEGFLGEIGVQQHQADGQQSEVESGEEEAQAAALIGLAFAEETVKEDGETQSDGAQVEQRGGAWRQIGEKRLLGGGLRLGGVPRAEGAADGGKDEARNAEKEAEGMQERATAAIGEIDTKPQPGSRPQGASRILQEERGSAHAIVPAPMPSVPAQ